MSQFIHRALKTKSLVRCSLDKQKCLLPEFNVVIVVAVVFILSSYSCFHQKSVFGSIFIIFRSTPLSRPNTVDINCRSVRPQKISSISMKSGMLVEVDE